MENYEITVGNHHGDLVGNTNMVIQCAVDKVASLGGGIVNILPGTYRMDDSLHLRSCVTVRGHGEDTILWKPPSISSKVIYYLGYGHYDVSVAEPEKFHIGMGVYVSDDESKGFYGTVATINRKNGNELGLTRMLNHDISLECNGKVVSVYPIISGYYINDAHIENLLIDGNSQENQYLNGCRGGGIFLLQAHDIVMRNVTVKNYNGDGISFQQCKNTVVKDSSCIDNAGHGLHPGSGSIGSKIFNTVCSRNARYGIYYCLRVSYSLCEGCTIEKNGSHGISIGHRDTDIIIRNNHIIENQGYGIYFRKDPMSQTGHRTLITENTISGNSIDKGLAEIRIDSSVNDLHILNNTFGKDAIYIDAPVKDVFVHGDHASSAVNVTCQSFKEEVSFCRPSIELPIDPDFVPYNAGLHLKRV